jgi:hypothetical protein
MVAMQTSVLLFPSKDSVTAHEFLTSLRMKRPRIEPGSGTSCSSSIVPSDGGSADVRLRHGPSIHLMVVDGTWTQAKKMCKALSTRVPCIRIDVDDHTSTLYTPLRKVGSLSLMPLYPVVLVGFVYCCDCCCSRQEYVEGRTSTLEAIAAALRDLGER